MKRLTLFLAVLLSSLPAFAAQQPEPPDGVTISSAQVSGFDLNRLSPDLQVDIARLAGTPLNRVGLGELAERIEAEHPWWMAALRVFQAPDGQVHVVFVVAHMGDLDQANVNSRYPIERVDVRGIPDSDLSAELRAELQSLVGKLLGSIDVEQLETKLRDALPDYEIRRHIARGGRAREIRLTFLANKLESARWLHFEPLRSSVVYHRDQGWGGLLSLSIGGRDFRVSPIIAMGHGDELVEEYSGFGVRFESRRLGSERLGASFELSSLEPSWRDATLQALGSDSSIPEPYGKRSTVAPMVTFAATRRVSLSAGVSITELEPLSGVPESQMASAFTASMSYDDQLKRGEATHDLAATFGVRKAAETLESDFNYTRYFGQAEYQYRWAKHTVLVSGMAGGISGEAPLFERFALGDTRTLRGWNKYDIAPAGGSRMFHTSVEYRNRGLAFFLDSGSVWDEGIDARTRIAAGFGFHGGPFFMTVGFPLNTDDVRAVFMTGIRFGGFGARKY